MAASKNDLEHYEPAPNGRSNHYWFDVNRDWSWGIHPETRNLTTEYQKWMPQIHVDHHEQGYNSNYFTMPGTTPRNKILPPTYEAWSDTFGRANIAAFNKNDISYFTREAFDFFYPGYGSSYPSIMGAIAMLTEQGGIAGGMTRIDQVRRRAVLQATLGTGIERDAEMSTARDYLSQPCKTQELR